MSDDTIFGDSVQGEDPSPEGVEELRYALLYLSRRWPVIPIGWDKVKGGWKKSLVYWEKYETELPTESNVRGWWKQWPYARVGVITGKISGIVAVDIDPRKGGSIDSLILPATLISKTGGGGFHYLYRHPMNQKIANASDWPRKGIDIRGDGGYIVVPPSIHESEARYEWALNFDPEQITDCPAWLIERDKQKSRVYELLDGVPEGGRNDAATRVIGLILCDLPRGEWETRGWSQAKNWNMKNNPPLREVELKCVFDSIASREDKQRNETEKNADEVQKPSKRKRISREYIELSGIKLFHDSLGKSYVLLNHDQHSELWPCKGAEMKREIGLFWYTSAGEPPSGEDVTNIAVTLDAKAQRDGKLISVDLRVAEKTINGSHVIFYDLADPHWRCVILTKNGWSIGPHTGVFFQRYKHTQEQVVPVQNGDLRELLLFLNITNPDEQLLLLCYVVSCFIPGIAHPILGLNGHKGSSKSTLMRMLKMIIDPSPLFTCSFPKDPSDVAMVFSQNWLATFDNVSNIPLWLSDILCKVCTGDAFMKRTLYTDSDAHIVEYQRCVMLNGINNPAEKPDLLDRMIIFWIESISKENRKPFDELWGDFMEALPRILGGVFNTLSRALALKKEVSRDGLSRLADFDLWGRAIAKALGYTEQDFIRAMAANSEAQNMEAIKQSPVALILLAWAEKVEPSASLEYTATELLKWFKDKADKASIDTRAHEWPKNGAALSRKINEIAINLLENGIKVVRSGNGKKIIIQKVSKNSENAVNAGDNPTGNNGVDAIISIFGGEVVDEREEKVLPPITLT